jgi:hypothetical protein
MSDDESDGMLYSDEFDDEFSDEEVVSPAPRFTQVISNLVDSFDPGDEESGSGAAGLAAAAGFQVEASSPALQDEQISRRSERAARSKRALDEQLVRADQEREAIAARAAERQAKVERANLSIERQLAGQTLVPLSPKERAKLEKEKKKEAEKEKKEAEKAAKETAKLEAKQAKEEAKQAKKDAKKAKQTNGATKRGNDDSMSSIGSFSTDSTAKSAAALSPRSADQESSVTSPAFDGALSPPTLDSALSPALQDKQMSRRNERAARSKRTLDEQVVRAEQEREAIAARAADRQAKINRANLSMQQRVEETARQDAQEQRVRVVRLGAIRDADAALAGAMAALAGAAVTAEAAQEAVAAFEGKQRAADRKAKVDRANRAMEYKLQEDANRQAKEVRERQRIVQSEADAGEIYAAAMGALADALAVAEAAQQTATALEDKQRAADRKAKVDRANRAMEYKLQEDANRQAKYDREQLRAVTEAAKVHAAAAAALAEAVAVAVDIAAECVELAQAAAGRAAQIAIRAGTCAASAASLAGDRATEIDQTLHEGEWEEEEEEDDDDDDEEDDDDEAEWEDEEEEGKEEAWEEDEDDEEWEEEEWEEEEEEEEEEEDDDDDEEDEEEEEEDQFTVLDDSRHSSEQSGEQRAPGDIAVVQAHPRRQTQRRSTQVRRQTQARRRTTLRKARTETGIEAPDVSLGAQKRRPTLIKARKEAPDESAGEAAGESAGEAAGEAAADEAVGVVSQAARRKTLKTPNKGGAPRNHDELARKQQEQQQQERDEEREQREEQRQRGLDLVLQRLEQLEQRTKEAAEEQEKGLSLEEQAEADVKSAEMFLLAQERTKEQAGLTAPDQGYLHVQLRQLASMRQAGVLTQEEFAAAKRKLLGEGGGAGEGESRGVAAEVAKEEALLRRHEVMVMAAEEAKKRKKKLLKEKREKKAKARTKRGQVRSQQNRDAQRAKPIAQREAEEAEAAAVAAKLRKPRRPKESVQQQHERQKQRMLRKKRLFEDTVSRAKKALLQEQKFMASKGLGEKEVRVDSEGKVREEEWLLGQLKLWEQQEIEMKQEEGVQPSDNQQEHEQHVPPYTSTSPEPLDMDDSIRWDFAGVGGMGMDIGMGMNDSGNLLGGSVLPAGSVMSFPSMNNNGATVTGSRPTSAVSWGGSALAGAGAGAGTTAVAPRPRHHRPSSGSSSSKGRGVIGGSKTKRRLRKDQGSSAPAIAAGAVGSVASIGGSALGRSTLQMGSKGPGASTVGPRFERGEHMREAEDLEQELSRLKVEMHEEKQRMQQMTVQLRLKERRAVKAEKKFAEAERQQQLSEQREARLRVENHVLKEASSRLLFGKKRHKKGAGKAGAEEKLGQSIFTVALGGEGVKGGGGTEDGLAAAGGGSAGGPSDREHELERENAKLLHERVRERESAAAVAEEVAALRRMTAFPLYTMTADAMDQDMRAVVEMVEQLGQEQKEANATGSGTGEEVIGGRCAAEMKGHDGDRRSADGGLLLAVVRKHQQELRREAAYVAQLAVALSRLRRAGLPEASIDSVRESLQRENDADIVGEEANQQEVAGGVKEGKGKSRKGQQNQRHKNRQEEEDKDGQGDSKKAGEEVLSLQSNQDRLSSLLTSFGVSPMSTKQSTRGTQEAGEEKSAEEEAGKQQQEEEDKQQAAQEAELFARLAALDDLDPLLDDDDDDDDGDDDDEQGRQAEEQQEGGGEEVEETWYPGIVRARNADGTYEVEYDDGDTESSVKRKFVRLPTAPDAIAVAAAAGYEELQAGTKVEAKYGADEDDEGSDGGDEQAEGADQKEQGLTGTADTAAAMHGERVQGVPLHGADDDYDYDQRRVSTPTSTQQLHEEAQLKQRLERQLRALGLDAGVLVLQGRGDGKEGAAFSCTKHSIARAEDGLSELMAPRLEALAHRFQLLGLDAEALVLHERALEMLLLQARANATAKRWGREHETEQRWQRWQQSRGGVAQQQQQQQAERAAQSQYGVLLKQKEFSVQQELSRVLAVIAIAHQSIAVQATAGGNTSSLQRQVVATGHQKALALSRQAMAALKANGEGQTASDDSHASHLAVTQLLQLQGRSLACLARLDFASATAAAARRLGGGGAHFSGGRQQAQYHSLHHEAIRCFNQALARLHAHSTSGDNGGADGEETINSWQSAPQVASTLFDVGLSMQQLGLLDEASAKFEKCAGICEVAFGNDSEQLRCVRSMQQRACPENMQST